jgi:hypothetical protein
VKHPVYIYIILLPNINLEYLTFCIIQCMCLQYTNTYNDTVQGKLHPMKKQWGSRGTLYSFFNLRLDRGGPLYLLGMTQYS